MVTQRILGTVAVMGASIALSGCVPQASTTPATPPATVTVTRPAPSHHTEDSSTTQGQSQAEPEKHAPEEVSDLQPKDSGARLDPTVFVRGYDPATGNGIVTAQKPQEFLPPDMAGLGPADVLATDLRWARWDSEKAVANCIVRVTGGGGPPTLHQQVRLTLDQVRTVEGTKQYTRYRIDWNNGTEPDVGTLEFN